MKTEAPVLNCFGILEKETLLDRAMLRYAYELEKGGSKVVELCDVACARKETDCQVPNLPIPIGWALKRSFTRKTRFNSAQKDYLQKKFEIGEKTGRKLDPVTVSQDSNGNRLFASSEFFDWAANPEHFFPEWLPNEVLIL